jgi:carbon starvation protein
VNQLLAALALLVITVYLRKKGGLKFLISGLPCLFMLVMTVWGVFLNQINFISKSNWLLMIINFVIMILALWMVAESVAVLKKKIN